MTIRIRPTHHYGQPTQHAMGSNHIRYSGGPTALRVTTDAPLSYVDREAAFVLTHENLARLAGVLTESLGEGI